MTKKKPGAKRGRPKGTGKGLDEKLFFNATATLRTALDAAAAARQIERSVLIREILERWAAEQPEPPPASPVPAPTVTAKKPATTKMPKG